MRQGKTLDNEIFSDGQNADYYDANPIDNDYRLVLASNFTQNFSLNFTSPRIFRFSIGPLPLWAKKHISEDTSPPISLTKGVVAPKGRWAQRAERTVGVKSFYASDSVIPFPGMQGIVQTTSEWQMLIHYFKISQIEELIPMVLKIVPWIAEPK